MTRDDFTWLLERYLDGVEGPALLPASVRHGVQSRLRSTPQERPLAIPSRLFEARPLPRLVLPIAAVVTVAVIGTGLWSLGGGTDPRASQVGSPANSADPPASTGPRPTIAPDLGVFEPARGRIVVPVGSHLEAVDPDDPASRVTIEPGDLGLGADLMPAGWSADGTKLAIDDENQGDSYVMDRTGSLTRIPLDELPGVLPACCSFVPSAWLSPDGTNSLAFKAPNEGPAGSLYIVDLVSVERSAVVEIAPFEFAGGSFQPPLPVWSPDGAHAAYVWSKQGNLDTPAVGIVDLASGTGRELASDWGLVRQLAWSPDGSRLLVVAGDAAPAWSPTLNPLVGPVPAGLYAVDVDDGEVREIATGHFIAAAWSPDGKRVAAIDYPGGHDLVVVNSDGSGSSRALIPLKNGPFTGVTWHPADAP